METHDLFSADGDDAVVVSVHAQLGAGRTEVVGRHGAALKVRVAAPPEQARANDALVKLLSEQLGVPADSVTVEAGEAGKAKRIRVAGVDPAGFGDRLELLLTKATPGGGRR
jgi:uncharacterized protein